MIASLKQTIGWIQTTGWKFECFFLVVLDAIMRTSLNSFEVSSCSYSVLVSSVGDVDGRWLAIENICQVNNRIYVWWYDSNPWQELIKMWVLFTVVKESKKSLLCQLANCRRTYGLKCILFKKNVFSFPFFNLPLVKHLIETDKKTNIKRITPFWPWKRFHTVYCFRVVRGEKIEVYRRESQWLDMVVSWKLET